MKRTCWVCTKTVPPRRRRVWLALDRDGSGVLWRPGSFRDVDYQLNEEIYQREVRGWTVLDASTGERPEYAYPQPQEARG